MFAYDDVLTAAVAVLGGFTGWWPGWRDGRVGRRLDQVVADVRARS